MTTNNMTGLKQRKTFEEVIDYIQNDKTKIKYPDRTAKFLRNSFELSQLDNAGMILMEQQQMREMKQREKEHLLRQLVANTSKSITEARAAHTDNSDDSASTVSAIVPTFNLEDDASVPTETAGASPVNAEIHQHHDILTPAQQQVNIAFPGALSSPQGPAQTGASSSSQGELAKAIEIVNRDQDQSSGNRPSREEVEAAKETINRLLGNAPNNSSEDEVEPRGPRGRPPGRGRGPGRPPGRGGG